MSNHQSFHLSFLSSNTLWYHNITAVVAVTKTVWASYVTFVLWLKMLVFCLFPEDGGIRCYQDDPVSRWEVSNKHNTGCPININLTHINSNWTILDVKILSFQLFNLIQSIYCLNIFWSINISIVQGCMFWWELSSRHQGLVRKLVVRCEVWANKWSPSQQWPEVKT